MMMGKLNRLSVALYAQMLMLGLTLKEDLRSLKDDERGLSGIVVAVLLILVAVLAVILLWGQLKGWLGTMWGNITNKANEIN